jgi:hypothetical protein
VKFAALVLFALALSAQTAKVVQLSEADAAKVRSAHDALDKAQKAWDAVQQQIRDEYVSTVELVADYGKGNAATILVNYAVSAEWSPYPQKFECAAAGSVIKTDGMGNLMPSSFDPDCQLRKAKEATERLKHEADAEKARQAEKDRIAKLPKLKVYTVKDEWRSGFEFSEDFRFIVPKLIVPRVDSQWGTTPVYPYTWK